MTVQDEKQQNDRTPAKCRIKCSVVVKNGDNIELHSRIPLTKNGDDQIVEKFLKANPDVKIQMLGKASFTHVAKKTITDDDCVAYDEYEDDFYILEEHEEAWNKMSKHEKYMHILKAEHFKMWYWLQKEVGRIDNADPYEKSRKLKAIDKKANPGEYAMPDLGEGGFGGGRDWD